MPNDLSHAMAPSFEGLPLTRLDDAGVTAAIQSKLFEELAPTSNFAKVIALDIIQVEVDIMRLRQAKAELQRTLDDGRINYSSHSHFTQRFRGKLISDIMRGRGGIKLRVAVVLGCYGETLSDVRARAFRRHAEITQKIDAQLERFERRRRNLARDLDLYQSSRARVIEAPGWVAARRVPAAHQPAVLLTRATPSTQQVHRPKRVSGAPRATRAATG